LNVNSAALGFRNLKSPKRGAPKHRSILARSAKVGNRRQEFFLYPHQERVCEAIRTKLRSIHFKGFSAFLPPNDKMVTMAGSCDERQLIARSLSGDPEADAVLLNQYHTMIRARAFRMAGSFDDAD
jgi:hypothetical protein